MSSLPTYEELSKVVKAVGDNAKLIHAMVERLVALENAVDRLIKERNEKVERNNEIMRAIAPFMAKETRDE